MGAKNRSPDRPARSESLYWPTHSSSRITLNISGSSYFRDIMPQFPHAEEHWTTELFIFTGRKYRILLWDFITFGEVLLSLKLAEMRPATAPRHATYCYLITSFNNATPWNCRPEKANPRLQYAASNGPLCTATLCARQKRISSDWRLPPCTMHGSRVKQRGECYSTAHTKTVFLAIIMQHCNSRNMLPLMGQL